MAKQLLYTGEVCKKLLASADKLLTPWGASHWG